MADGIVRRIIKLILDKDSADQVKKESQGLGESVENTWKETARKIAGYLGAAFLLKKMVDFGRAAVAAASESEAAWGELRNTIQAAGGDFDKLNGDLQASAAAFQDATIHDDDSYAVSLSRLITLTGDVSASTQNMGLVANVAAQFFKGDLAAATDLVAKVMNGNVAALGRMGIEAKSAQEGLEILANRSMGAAEQKTQTFSGRLAQLNNHWGNFLEEIGMAITQSDGASNAFDLLQTAVLRLTGWVKENSEAISNWVIRGVNFAIVAADVFMRALMGLGNTIQGGFNTALGLIVKGLAYVTQGFGAAMSASARWQELTGQKSAEDARKYADGIKAQADALHEWADAAIRAGSEQVAKGLSQFANPMFSPVSLPTGPNRPRAQLPGSSGSPAVSAGSKTPEQEAMDKAMEEFLKAGERISVMQTVLGNKFNWLDAEIQRTTDLLTAMAENGVNPADESFQALQRQLQFLTQETTIADAALAEMNTRLAQDGQIAAMTGVESFDMLKSQQQELARVMRLLITQGMDPQDARLQALAKRYREVTQTIEQQSLAMQIQAGAAGFLGEAIGAAMEGGIGPAAAQKARQNQIEGMEMLARAAGFALFGNPAGAAASLRQAASHFAIAVAWRALASSSRAPSTGASGVSASTASSGAGAGTGINDARASSSRATSQSRVPAAEVSLYLIGEGFDAVNPRVQRVVYGAQRNAEELYGNNARVRTVRT